MSERSYRRNVDRKVAGQYFAVCKTAGAERISPDHTLPPDIHAEHDELIPGFNQKSGLERYYSMEEYGDFLDRFFGCLGGLTCNDVVFFRPKSIQEFVGRVSAATRRGDKVLLDLSLGKELHAVGLQPMAQPNVYNLKSNWKPFSLYGGVTLGQLYPLLAPEETEEIPGDIATIDYPFYDYNVTILPAV